MTSALSVNASDIILSSDIKPKLRAKILKDLDLLENFRFKGAPNDQILKIMGINAFSDQQASGWLNQRVNYIVAENSFSAFNLRFKKMIFIDSENVDFPNANIIPYSLEKKFEEVSSELSPKASQIIMSNIGTALYFRGKQKRLLYGIRISRGPLKSADKVIITSPLVGIIQMGEGLFNPKFIINKDHQDALANSISRLGILFHEARHSDGKAMSLGFMHTRCPPEHDYAGKIACDENLNGPYAVAALMMTQMSKACEESCSLKDKETLNMLIIDNASRMLKTTHKGGISKYWDPSPESL